jgi:hypothetical protein
LAIALVFASDVAALDAKPTATGKATQKKVGRKLEPWETEILKNLELLERMELLKNLELARDLELLEGAGGKQ